MNVTLLFSVARYREVAEAYLLGLEEAERAGRALESIASVASFFLSRVDAPVDHRLEEIARGAEPRAGQARALEGQAA